MIGGCVITSPGRLLSTSILVAAMIPEALTYRFNGNSAWVPAARTYEWYRVYHTRGMANCPAALSPISHRGRENTERRVSGYYY